MATRKRRDRKAYSAAYRKANPEMGRESARVRAAARRKAKPGQVKASNAAYRAANSDKIKADGAAYRKANPDKHNADNAAWLRGWRRANPERAKAKTAAWRKANPEVMRANSHRRRAHVAGNGGSFTAAQWRAKLALHGYRCFFCGVGGSLTIDHDVPIARGGTNNIGNLLPACQSCNSRKGTMTAAEYLSTLQSEAA